MVTREGLADRGHIYIGSYSEGVSRDVVITPAGEGGAGQCLSDGEMFPAEMKCYIILVWYTHTHTHHDDTSPAQHPHHPREFPYVLGLYGSWPTPRVGS